MKTSSLTQHLEMTGKIAGVIILAGGLFGCLNTTQPKKQLAASCQVSEPNSYLYQKLSLSHPPSPGESVGDTTFKFEPDGKCHSLTLQLKPVDLSTATELRFEVKADATFGEIDVTLRDQKELMSATIKIAKYVKGTNDGYQVVRIPAAAFKTKGWDMKSVKLMFVGRSTTVVQGGPSFTIRTVEAGFLK